MRRSPTPARSPAASTRSAPSPRSSARRGTGAVPPWPKPSAGSAEPNPALVRPRGVDDEDAEAFCRATYARLAGALGLMCGESGVGEELAQEALLRVWERWPSVRAMDSPEAWVFRVGFNLANSRLRRVVAERRANQRVS